MASPDEQHASHRQMIYVDQRQDVARRIPLKLYARSCCTPTSTTRTRPPIRSRSSGATARRRSRSRRLLRGGARLRPRGERAAVDRAAAGGHGAASGGIRPRVRSRPPRPGLRAARAPLDPRARSRGAAAGSCSGCSTIGHDRRILRSTATTRPRPTSRRRSTASSRRALATDLRRRYGRRRPAPGVVLLLSAAVGGQRLQAAEPVPALDGARTRSTSGSGRRVSPSRLVVPLDTHVIRLGRCLRLTRYTSPGWKMAADITASLRAIDPGRSGALRLLALPRGHDERLRLQPRRSAIRSVRCAVRAGHALVHGGGLGHHPLDGEPLCRPCQSGLAHSPSLVVVSEAARIACAIAVIARRHEHARSRRPRRPRVCRRSAVATTALPHAIASSSAVPRPSVTELMTNRSKLFMQPSTSVRNPGRNTCFSSWCSRR